MDTKTLREDPLGHAVDQLPSDLDFDVRSLPERGLTQGIESHHLSQPDHDTASASKEDDRQSSITDHRATPDTSFTGPGRARTEEENGEYEIASQVSIISRKNTVTCSTSGLFPLHHTQGRNSESANKTPATYLSTLLGNTMSAMTSPATVLITETPVLTPQA